MGLVSKQAFSNSIYSFIGVAIGAINTIFILPRAFEDTMDDLGLVRVLLSYATIIGSIFGFGVYNLIIREITDEKSEEYKKSIQGYAFAICLIGLGIVAIVLNFNPEVLMNFINEEEAPRVIQKANSLLLLCFVIIFSQMLNSYIISKHKSPFVQMVQGPYLKLAYLILSVSYLIKPFSFDLFLNLFVFIYTFSVLLLFIYALVLGYKVEFKMKLIPIKELLNFSVYTFFDKGATIIVNNLDLAMIAWLMQFADVGYYSIAFFIGAVIIIPQRAIMTPSYPLVSNFLTQNKMPELKKLYKQTSINQLVLGGTIFVLIWINIDDLFGLMPDNFAPGKWVVFYIGLSKIFILSTGISGPLIVLSKYYRTNLVFNFILVILTLITNYFLILEFGITGAAMGTCITFGIFNILKLAYIRSKFNIQPFTISSIKTTLIFIVTIMGFAFVNLDWHPILAIGFKSAIAGIIMLLLFRYLKVKAEILTQVWSILK